MLIYPLSSNNALTALAPPLPKSKITGLALSALTALIFATMYNVKIWQIYFSNNDVSSLTDILQAFCFFIFVYALLLSFFSVVTFRWIQKGIVIFLFLAAAPAFYFSLSLGVLFDVSMLQNAFETDIHEAIDLLTTQFWFVFIFLGIIPATIIYKSDVSYSIFWKQLLKNISTVIVAVCAAISGLYPYYGELSFFVRNNNTELSNSLLPIAPLRATYRNLISINSERNIVKEILDHDAIIVSKNLAAVKKPIALVVIIGETARESSFSLKDVGLSEQSEKLLNRKNLFYFSNFWSCGTNTALSVPCMFSLYAKADYRREMNRKYENVAEIINRVGYDVVWRNNNSGCKGICGRIYNDPINANNSANFFHDDEFYDEALVDDLTQRITRSNDDQIIFLHQLGSHGPAYFKRVPNEYKILQPACESQDFAKCDREEIVNAYNNTILYTKRVVNQAIEKLDSISEHYDTILIYLSDHGESTGEKGIYLHGIPYIIAPDEQTHIPALVWMSDSYIENRGVDRNCLKNKTTDRFSHDNFSHTLLGILDIQTTVYDKELDLFDLCINQ